MNGGHATGAWRTLVRGVSLSPELRVGLPATLVLALVATAGRAVVPVAVQRTIDDGLVAPTGVDVEAVARVVAWAAVAVLVTALASGWMNSRLARVVETALSNLRVRAFRHIHDLSMLHQASHQRGSLVGRVTTDIDEISRFMQWAGLNLITATGQLIIATLVMFAYSWRLTIVVLVVFFPFVLVARWFQRRLHRAYRVVRERVAGLLGVVAEAVVGASVIRAYGIRGRTRDRLDTAIEGHRRAAVRAGGLVAGFSGTGELFGAVATSAVVVAGVLLGVDGQVTVGVVVAFVFLVSLFVDPVLIAGEVINEGQTAIAGWRRVHEVLDLPRDVADPGDKGRPLPEGPLGVSFDGVWFGYPRGDDETLDEPALIDVDVQVAAGARVAIVGETGSGKTTFAKLLTRLMDPTAGTVRIGGVPLRDVRFSSLRRRVVMVPQDGVLLDTTVAQNVAMGADDVDDVRVAAAFAQLGLADWIASLPAGIHTPVGERGAALSAGERQLVALARAAIADPDVLVLDEATSAVDPASDVRLQRALGGLTAGRTVITIAHRMSTAESADEVFVFAHGRLVEQGRHEVLIRGGGVYARLHADWVKGTGVVGGPG